MNPVAQKYGAAILAGVDLLPSEIAERKTMRSVRSLAVLIVVIAVGVVIAMFALFFGLRTAAQAGLDDAMLAQDSAVADRDGKAGVYEDVRTREAEEYALAQVGFGEMDYAQLTAAIQSTVDKDTSFDLIEVFGPSAMGLGGGTQDSVFRGGVGIVTFMSRATSYDVATQHIARLEALPGIGHVRGTAEAYAPDEGGVYWEVKGSAVITDLRLTGRLVPQEGIAGVDALTIIAEQDPAGFPIPSPEPSAEPAASPSPSASEEG